jgi:hypothetical protein
MIGRLGLAIHQRRLDMLLQSVRLYPNPDRPHRSLAGLRKDPIDMASFSIVADDGGWGGNIAYRWAQLGRGKVRYCLKGMVEAVEHYYTNIFGSATRKGRQVSANLRYTETCVRTQGAFSTDMTIY